MEPADAFDSVDPAEPVASVASDVPVAAGDDAAGAEGAAADDDLVPDPSWQAVRDRARAVPVTASSMER